MSKRLTEEQKRELFSMYKTYKYSYKELAEYFNKSVSSIACLLNREGLKGKRQNNHYRKYPINQNYFDKIDSEDKAYFLGLLSADGCNCKGNTKVTIWLQEGDKDILEKFTKVLQPTKPLFYHKSKKQYGMHISNRNISEALEKQGCIPQKTLTLKFPTNTQVPKHLIRHYLRGFFDGDGWLGNKDISITASESFCNSLQKFLLKEFNWTTRKRNKGKVIELNFHRESTKGFLDWIYENSNIYLERKYNKYLKYYKNKL